MTVPLILLAIPSVVVGFWGAPPPFGGAGFQRFLEGAEASEQLDPLLAAVSLALALAGIGLAYLMYYKRALSPAAVTARFGALYTLFVNKYYLDDLYQWLIDHVVLALSRFAGNVFDPKVIDGAVNGVGWLAVATSNTVRRIQTGRVQSYAMYVFAGLAVISFFTIVFRGSVR